MSNDKRETILITGASSEIGSAIMRKFDQPENLLILQAFRNSKKLNELTKELKSECKVITCDFSVPEDLNSFLKDLPQVNTVINVSALTHTDILVNLSEQDILKMLTVNILSVIRICQAVLPGMIVRHEGSIVNISSLAASRGNRGQSVYAGTKGFLESFTRSIASEYGMKGIRANCVAPGAIAAGSLKTLLNQAGDEIKKNTSLNRLGSPEEIAEVVYFLCSKNSSFINGAVIPVNGGFMKGL